MDKKALCERYIEVVNSSRSKEEALEAALQAINSDNYFMGLVPDEFTEFFNEMFSTLVGSHTYDWVTWWLHETDQKQGRIWINEVEILINSFEELWEAVLKDEG